MRKTKKKLLMIISACAFALLMMFNVSVSMDNKGTDACLSLSGMKVMAASTQEVSNCTCAEKINWYGACRGETIRLCEGGSDCADVCG